MVDKKYCMSSYLAFRYINKDNVDFYEGLHHRNIIPKTDAEKTLVYTAEEIGAAVSKTVKKYADKKRGVFLSGGMDSAIVASYMQGAEAYTFRFLNGTFQQEELKRAEYFAKCYNLNLHYIDITWDTVENYLDVVIKAKNAPVHSIEPQLLQAALQAKKDGVEVIVIGNCSDYIFGGMDQLLAKDWTVEEFQERYTFIKPEAILNDPYDTSYLFEQYRQGEKIDFLKFMAEVCFIESLTSYFNAFEAAGMAYIDPYSDLKMGEKLDLKRIRHGESKYLIRELMKQRYPDIPVPNKNPMPRPVDSYFANWQGPIRHEFKQNLDMTKFTGNQKWQMYCLERFLNIYEPEK